MPPTKRPGFSVDFGSNCCFTARISGSASPGSPQASSGGMDAGRCAIASDPPHASRFTRSVLRASTPESLGVAFEQDAANSGGLHYRVASERRFAAGARQRFRSASAIWAGKTEILASGGIRVVVASRRRIELLPGVPDAGPGSMTRIGARIDFNCSTCAVRPAWVASNKNIDLRLRDLRPSESARRNAPACES